MMSVYSEVSAALQHVSKVVNIESFSAISTLLADEDFSMYCILLFEFV